jgi:two-component system chemotaxis response regulator CheY
VEEAQSGQEALSKLHAGGPVDIVLLDWNMPEMDGCEVLSLIRSQPRYRTMRVMMVTTESEMSQVAVALEAGANEYLMKPFDRESLLEKLVLLGMDPAGRH